MSELSNYFFPSSTKSSTNIHTKNLLTIDFTNQNEKIDSPRSKLALLHLGIDEHKLYYLSKNEYINKHPELRKESSAVKNKHYRYYEEKRKKRLEKAIQKREEIKNGELSLFTSSRNEKTSTQFYDSGAIKREYEQFNLMKKQNLCEIKNLIDFEINLSKKRYDNEEKLRMQREKEEKMNMQKKKERLEKENMEKMMEMEKEEQMRKEKIKLNKEYKEFFMNQVKEFKKEERERLKMQKMTLKKQLERQKREEEFRSKLQEKFQQHQMLLENKQKEIDMKNEERRKRVEVLKKEISNRWKQEQIKREKKCFTANMKKNEMIQMKYERYKERQENILKAKQEEEYKKREEILEQKKKREQKEKKNIETKNKNEQLKEERKEKLLLQFKLNDDKIQNQKNTNLRILNDKLFKSFVKKNEMEDKIKEKDSQLKFQNYIKLKEIEDKHKKVDEMQRQKLEIARQKLKLQEEMKKKKEEMLEKVTKILAQGKCTNKEEIYSQIFTKEDMDIIYGKNKNKSAFMFYNENNRRKPSARKNAQSFEGSLSKNFSFNERPTYRETKTKRITLSKSQSMGNNLFLTSNPKQNKLHYKGLPGVKKI